MSEERRFGAEDLTYREWHRSDSIGRFITTPIAVWQKMIDLDAVVLCEYDAALSKPVALIEAMRGSGPADSKPCTVTRRLAEMAGIAAYVVVYKPAIALNRSSRVMVPDIDRFWVRELTPRPSALWSEMTPAQYADFIVTLRRGEQERGVA